MIVIEIHSGEEMVWGGTLADIPDSGAVIALNFPPAESGTERPPKFYRVINTMWSIVEGYPINQSPPRVSVIEIDPSTGKPKQSLIQPAQRIH